MKINAKIKGNLRKLKKKKTTYKRMDEWMREWTRERKHK